MFFLKPMSMNANVWHKYYQSYEYCHLVNYRREKNHQEK